MLKKTIFAVLLLCASAQAQNVINRTNNLSNSGRRRDLRWNCGEDIQFNIYTRLGTSVYQIVTNDTVVWRAADRDFSEVLYIVKTGVVQNAASGLVRIELTDDESALPTDKIYDSVVWLYSTNGQRRVIDWSLLTVDWSDSATNAAYAGPFTNGYILDYSLVTELNSPYYTGTPVYAEADPVWAAEKAGYATGTPVYAESDPKWSAVSNGFIDKRDEVIGITNRFTITSSDFINDRMSVMSKDDGDSEIGLLAASNRVAVMFGGDGDPAGDLYQLWISDLLYFTRNYTTGTPSDVRFSATGDVFAARGHFDSCITPSINMEGEEFTASNVQDWNTSVTWGNHASAGYATGTPLYAEIYQGTITGGTIAAGSSDSVVISGPNASITWDTNKVSGGSAEETDPVWESEKAGYSTGTPLYAETYTGDFKADGSVPMTGDGNFGGNDVTNLRTLDSVGTYADSYGIRGRYQQFTNQVLPDNVLQTTESHLIHYPAANWAMVANDDYVVYDNEFVFDRTNGTSDLLIYNTNIISAGLYKVYVDISGEWGANADDMTMAIGIDGANYQLAARGLISDSAATETHYLYLGAGIPYFKFSNTLDGTDLVISPKELSLYLVSTRTAFQTTIDGGDLTGDWELGGSDIATTMTVANASSLKVSKTGDVMTGALILQTNLSFGANINIGTNTLASGATSVVIGNNATNTMADSVVIGDRAKNVLSNYGVAIGAGSVASGASSSSESTAVGSKANGTGYGTSIGADSVAYTYGAAIGNDADGYIYGSAVGYLANAIKSGVAIGLNANGSLTNIAIGAQASCVGGNERVSIGHNVTNAVDNSTAIRGNLYLDGATNIYTRATFGTGNWGNWLASQSQLVTNIVSITLERDGANVTNVISAVETQRVLNLNLY